MAGGPDAVASVELLAQALGAEARDCREAAGAAAAVERARLFAALLVEVPGRDAAGGGVPATRHIRDVVAKVFEHHLVPLVVFQRVLPLRSLGELTPRYWRQHHREVAADMDRLVQGPRAQPLQRAGAFAKDLLVFAVGAHRGHNHRDASAAPALVERLLLPTKGNQGPHADSLQLGVRPVPPHGLNDAADAAVLVRQEAGPEASDDQHTFRQDVGAVCVPPHHHIERLERLRGHAVVVKHLGQGRQQREAFDLHLGIVPEEAHRRQRAVEAFECPDLRQLPPEADDPGPVAGDLPRTDVEPPEHLASAELDVLLLGEVFEGLDEVRGEILFDEVVHATLVVCSQPGDDLDAAGHDRAFGVEAPGERQDPLDGVVRTKPQAPLCVLVRAL
mmetsp:Transcript_43554/g.125920  ORF Transcript_43554/g.125920 Transcript_43554/m.125920 type:complete len:390 (-) Transcript_43554:2022-3191(-)